LLGPNVSHENLFVPMTSFMWLNYSLSQVLLPPNPKLFLKTNAAKKSYRKILEINRPKYNFLKTNPKKFLQ